MNNEELAKMDFADLEIEYRQVVMQRDDLLKEVERLRKSRINAVECLRKSFRHGYLISGINKALVCLDEAFK